MKILADFLAANPLLLLFVIAAVGYPLGRLNFKGVSLGLASLLFVGIAFGAADPRLKLPDAYYMFGLAIFVYSVGLHSADGFFGSLNRIGFRRSAITIVTLLVGAILTVGALSTLGLGRAMGAGLFCGSFTNSPALAAAVEALRGHGSDASTPVVAYSIAYPMGVLGPMMAFLAVRTIFKKKQIENSPSLPVDEAVITKTVEVTQKDASGHTKHTLVEQIGGTVVVGRILRDDEFMVPTSATKLAVGDRITLVGKPSDLDAAVAFVGQETSEDLTSDAHEVMFRRIFVSRPEVAGRNLRELKIPERLGGVVTRLRRGDVDFVPSGDTVLELGDRVRVTAHRENLEGVAQFLGDSYRSLSEVDLLNFSLGLALGLLLGAIPIPLPGGLHLKLGFAGGPLVVALVLARVKRTGSIAWSLPYSANLTLRQIGLMLFAAGIGTIAGEGFAKTLAHGPAPALFIVGAFVSTIVPFLMMVFTVGVMKLPMGLASGLMARTQPQPVLLAFAQEQTEGEGAALGYATVFPIATILKIVVQILLARG